MRHLKNSKTLPFPLGIIDLSHQMWIYSPDPPLPSLWMCIKVHSVCWWYHSPSSYPVSLNGMYALHFALCGILLFPNRGTAPSRVVFISPEIGQCYAVASSNFPRNHLVHYIIYYIHFASLLHTDKQIAISPYCRVKTELTQSTPLLLSSP